jgi:hypothetical protein
MTALLLFFASGVFVGWLARVAVEAMTPPEQEAPARISISTVRVPDTGHGGARVLTLRTTTTARRNARLN